MSKKSNRSVKESGSKPQSLEKRLQNKLKKPARKQDIAGMLGLKGQAEKFESVFESMLKTGAIIELKNGLYGPSKSMGMVSGILDVNPRGFGFLIPDSGGDDIFIPLHLMSTAFDKDRVLVKVMKEGKGGKREGKVVSILERRTGKLTGTIEKTGKFYFAAPDDKKILKNIFLESENITDKDIGKRVIIELLEWESPKLNPVGRMVDFIKADNKMDLMGTLLLVEHGFDDRFPKDVEREAQSIEFNPVPESSFRKDLTASRIITIDPEDAKDFDDAVSIEKIDGKFKVGVHIADVSFFVKKDSAIDKEAYKRATSVYLLDKTVPMLPERLSNDLCSLKPNVLRYAMSCEFIVDSLGNISSPKIFPSLIKSSRRFNYKEAASVLESGKTDPFYGMLSDLRDAAVLLRKAAMKNGRLDFDIPEVEVIFDKNKNPVDIVQKKRLETHKLIEDFMVAANSTVSEYLTKKSVGSIYRIHEEPKQERLENLREVVKLFGYPIKSMTPQSMQKLLEKSEKSDSGFLVREMFLKSMMKAKYSPENKGHYGLGLKYYTHFTSPIRRYPDLMIHRILRGYIEGGAKRDYDLDLISKHSTEREWSAEKAERDSIDIAKMLYLANSGKSEFKGVISSVTPFGIFIQLKDIFVEGLVRFRDMVDDFYQLNPDEVSITGLHTKNRITIGDLALVKVSNINPEKMEMDLKIERFLKKQQ